MRHCVLGPGRALELPDRAGNLQEPNTEPSFLLPTKTISTTLIYDWEGAAPPRPSPGHPSPKLPGWESSSPYPPTTLSEKGSNVAVSEAASGDGNPRERSGGLSHILVDHFFGFTVT